MTIGSYWHVDVCLSTRANLLMIGPDNLTDAFLKAVRPYLQEPVAILRGGETFALPPGPVGTMILVNVGAFTLAQQAQLLESMNDSLNRAQVMSTSATPLMPMLAANRFMEGLYYRLNTIYLDVTTSSSDSPFTASSRDWRSPRPVTRN